MAMVQNNASVFNTIENLTHTPTKEFTRNFFKVVKEMMKDGVIKNIQKLSMSLTFHHFRHP